MANATFRFSPEEINKIVCDFLAETYNLRKVTFMVKSFEDGSREIEVSDGQKEVLQFDRDWLETTSVHGDKQFPPFTIKPSSKE